ncbi:hypothetical protein OROMI_023913 [Orobanche minor]
MQPCRQPVGLDNNRLEQRSTIMLDGNDSPLAADWANRQRELAQSSDDEATIDNPFASLGRQNDRRLDDRHRWESGLKIDLPDAGTMTPNNLLDWLIYVEEVLDYKGVPANCRVPLVVYGIITRTPVDILTSPASTPVDRRVEDLLADMKRVHSTTHAQLEASTDRYKKAADVRRRDVHFDVGDYIWAVLTKDTFPSHEYNKLSSRKIGPAEIVEKINSNAYRLRLPSHIRTSDVFNVIHLAPYVGNNSSGYKVGSDSRANRFEDGKNDENEVALLFLDKHDRLIKPKSMFYT